MTSKADALACFYINLDRAPVRRRYMEEMAQSRGISLARVAAVDGATLDAASCRAVNPTIPNTKLMTPSEIGCFLSHRKAWEAIAHSGQPWGCVLEDDVQLSDDIALYLNRSDWIPPDVGIVRLETFPIRRVMLSNKRTHLPGDRHLAETLSFSLGAAGYLITAQIAAELVAASEVFHVPLDVFLNGKRANPLRDPRIWQITPAVCVQQKNAKRNRFLPQEAEPPGISYSLVKPRKTLHGWRKTLHHLIDNLKKNLINRRGRLQARLMNATWDRVPFRK